jgi:hypothetical protein
MPTCFLTFEAYSLHTPSRNEFVCMKSMVSNYSSVEREILAYDALSAASNASDAPGKQYVRHALDQFKIDHAGRSYHFLVHEPLGISVDFLQKTLLKGRLPFDYCYDLVDYMLEALEYLHKHANLIHAGKYFTLLCRQRRPVLTFTTKTFKQETFSFALRTSACSKRWRNPSLPIPAREKSALRRLFSSRAAWKALCTSGSVKRVPQSSATLVKHGLPSRHTQTLSSHLSIVRQRFFCISHGVNLSTSGILVVWFVSENF